MFFSQIFLIFLVMVLSLAAPPTVFPPLLINNGTYIKTKSISGRANSSILVNVFCDVKPISRYSTYTRVSAFIVKPLNNIFVRFQIFKRERTFIPFVINVREDFCKFMSLSSGTFFKIAYEFGSHLTNVNHSCPYYGLIEGKGSNTDIDISKWPNLIPSGEFRLDMTIEAGRPLQFAAFLTGKVEVGRYRGVIDN